MLGVLKRRWKPKSSSSGSKVPRSDTNSLDNCDRDKSSSNRIHQVHPVLDSQVFLGYEKSAAVRPETPPLTPQDNTNNCYQLTPNICVEAGRIQFIRQESEPARIDSSTGTKYPELDRNSVSPLITVTRSVQTEEDDNRKIQTSLTNRIAELEAALEEAQKNELRDKQTITKLQKSLSRRESTQRDADRERRLRADSETRAKQALQEAARCRSRLKLLTHEFARMEETVRSMLTYKKQVEQYKQDKAVLSQTFENRCKQYQSTISRLNLEINTLRQQLETVSRESNTEDILQAQTTALQRHAEESRKQYERCLDDVANQVVRALLAQKDLKEEVGLLNNKIQELETQNRALTLMLIHQLHGDSPSTPLDLIITDEERNNKSRKTSPTSILCTNIKHCNSFNSEVLDESPKNEITYLNVPVDKRLSVDTSSIIDTRLSLEDKKRHQVLTKLWTELKGTEVTPKKLLEALSAVDSALWVPPKRPVSLNLQLQANKYKTGIVTNSNSGETNFKVEEEVTGNESPESGNRDEGYSTMSSDVQADVTRGSGDATTLPRRDLEDLKEASDETDVADNAKILVADNKDPDILYIPLNLLNLKQRNSFPPGKDILPFQHIMRSFSDSHLCIKITTTPTPCYTFSSPISSSPSFLLLDITEKAFNPLIMTKWNNGNFVCDDKTSQLSWSSTADERLECTTWDAEYIQRWLRLDETRSALQQQHRDMLELEYDRTELEDWSLSLSNDDLREHWKKMDATTPSQISISTLPSIQENNQLELEEDSNEYLWNNSSYMADKEGRELVTLLMDGTNSDKQQWPYSAPQQQISPDNSWSSGASDCFSHEPETCSKRSSAALSGSSDDTGEMPAIGTDFTRDFYRLVKFESTKSLASISSRSLGGGTTGCLSENGERVTTPSINVVQEKFSTTINDDDTTKEFNIEGPPQDFTELKISDSQYSINNKSDVKSSDSENYVTLKQLCEEFSMNNSKLAYADEICLVTPLDLETENCSNISERPVDICSSVNVEITSSSRDNHSKVEEKEEESNELYESISDISLSTNNCTSESLTSSLSTPDTVASKIPLRKTSKIPKTSTNQIYNNNNNNNNNSCKETKIPQSKKNSKSPKLMKIVHVQQPNSQVQHLITSERLPQCSSGIVSNIIDGPPHRAQNFHERATSKDVIDELNRMIKNGEETQTAVSNCTGENFTSPVKLDQACRPTGWVHVERDVDLTDPKARANLLDVMMASISSDSSPTSSCGGSVASDSTEDPPDYGQLHKIHKFHRQKKANAVRPEMAVVRASLPVQRPTIIGRPDFYVRYGDKEREAVASFDFLDDLSTTSSSLTCSMDEGLLLEDGGNLGRCKI